MKKYVSSSLTEFPWPAFLLLAGGELILAVVATSLLASNLASGFSHRPVLGSVVGGDWLNALAELPAASISPVDEAATSSIAGAALLTLPLSAVSLILHAFLYAFASGAALGAMRAREPGLWRSGAKWFFPMLRLGLWMIAALVLLGGAALLVLSAAPVSPTAKAALWLVWIGLISSWFELARARMPAADVRSSHRALGQALRLLVYRSPTVIPVWLLLAIGNLALYTTIATLSFVLTSADPIVAWSLTALTVGAGSSYKLFRLGVQFQLAR